MSQLLKTWWKAFSFYAFWDDSGEPDWDEEDRRKPIVSFSFESWLTETRPLSYYDTCDKGRWRGVHFRVHLSRYLIAMTFPFMTLPDHVPTEWEKKMRAKFDTPEEKAKRKKLAEELFGATKKL